MCRVVVCRVVCSITDEYFNLIELVTFDDYLLPHYLNIIDKNIKKIVPSGDAAYAFMLNKKKIIRWIKEKGVKPLTHTGIHNRA